MHAAARFSGSFVALLAVVAAQEAEAPGDAALAQRLRGGRTVATMEGYFASVSPDGSAIAVVDHERKVALIHDAKSGQVRTAPNAGQVACISLLPSGRGCWLGLHDGSIVHVPSEGDPRRFAGVAISAIDGIECVGGNVAWSSSGDDRGGVLDARDGSARFAADTPFGGYRQPRMFLSRDGRHVVHFAMDPKRGGRRLAVVRDSEGGKQLATANSYMAKRSRAVVFGLDGLFSAARVASSSWQLQRLDLVTLEVHVIDDQLRGKHFVDLFLSPSSRYLMEGDYEDEAAVLYYLAHGGAHKRELGAGTVPVGFLQLASRRDELAITTNVGSRMGLSAWSCASGELVAVLPCGDGKRITTVGSLLGGRGMWLVYSKQLPRLAAGNRTVRCVDCVRFAP